MATVDKHSVCNREVEVECVSRDRTLHSGAARIHCRLTGDKGRHGEQDGMEALLVARATADYIYGTYYAIVPADMCQFHSVSSSVASGSCARWRRKALATPACTLRHLRL